MDVCQRSLRRADHTSRGVLPTAVRRCVWSRNLVNEEAMAHWGAVSPKTTKHTLYKSLIIDTPWRMLQIIAETWRNAVVFMTWGQFVVDKLVYNFTSFTKNELYLVSKNACLYVLWPNVYDFLVLWYVDTALHTLAHASTARIQREIETAHSAG